MLGLMKRGISERRMEQRPTVGFTIPTPNPVPSIETMMTEEIERDLKVQNFVKDFIATADPYVAQHPESRSYMVYERLARKMLPMFERRFGPLK